MPFVGPHPTDPRRWRPIATVDLRQLPVERRWKVDFKVIREFGYTDLPPDRGTPEAPEWSTSAVQHVVPRGMVTDLASVPVFLWGVIASYGRQTLPAILHDLLCFAAARRGQPAGHRHRLRREADDLFRRTLWASGSGILRRWLMWSAVRLFGHLSVGIAYVLVLVAVIVAAAVGGPGMVWVPATAVVVTLTMAGFASVERCRDPSAGAGEFTAAHVEPRAFTSLLGAMLIAMVAAPPILAIAAATAVVEFVIGLGERTAPAGPGEPEPAEGATVRITWTPLVGPDDAAPEGSS